MSALFGNKNIKEVMFGNKAVIAIYRGATLVWQKISKLLAWDFGGGSNDCYEIIPNQDIVLSDLSIFCQYSGDSNTTCNVRIINECGLLIAESSQYGVAAESDLYNLTGFMNTISSLGTITLFKDNKYYINIKKNNGAFNFAKYQGESGNYKSFGNVSDMWLISGAGERKSYGMCSTLDDIKSIDVGYFGWNGGPIGNNMQPVQGTSQEPYPYLLKRNISRIKHIFTDEEFNNVPVGQYNDDIAKYAYIYYIMGNTIGDEFIMNTNYYDRGFAADPNSQTLYFSNNQYKIYTTKWPFDHNKITSMTPIDNEPQNPAQWDIYYKSDVNAWTGSVGKKRAVVTWNGTEWIAAVNWSAEWDVDETYNATNYCETITMTNDWTARNFMKLSVQTGSKWYFKANNIEV